MELFANKRSLVEIKKTYSISSDQTYQPFYESNTFDFIKHVNKSCSQYCLFTTMPNTEITKKMFYWRCF